MLASQTAGKSAAACRYGDTDQGGGRECSRRTQSHADEVSFAVGAEGNSADGVPDSGGGPIKAVATSEGAGAVRGGIRHAYLLADHGDNGKAAGEDQQDRRHKRSELGGHAPAFGTTPLTATPLAAAQLGATSFRATPFTTTRIAHGGSDP